MKSKKLVAGAVPALALAAVTLASCGGDDVVERPAHRPISVIYVAGELTGPWQARTEGLADGVKLAIAERDGLIGERAISSVVVPIEQRDGTTVSAGIGGGRILRDSRAIAVLGTWSATQLPLAAPQLNGGELSLIQYGSGMLGLTEPEQPGEPGRFEPSGVRYALRGVPPDSSVAQRIRALRTFQGAQVVPLTAAYEAGLKTAAAQRAAEARKRLAKAIEDGDEPPLPSTDPALTNPSPEVPDAQRMAATIAKEIGGTVVDDPSKVSASKPTILITDPTEVVPDTAVRPLAKRSRGPLLAIDGADREFAQETLTRSGASDGLMIRRTIGRADSQRGREIRERERETFGRDRGDAVVAGYLAAQRVMELAASQPERTIDRVTFAKTLTGAAPQDPNLPASASGDATLGKVYLYELRGGQWARVAGTG